MKCFQGKTKTYYVNPTDTCINLFQKVLKKEGVHNDQCCYLVYQGKNIINEFDSCTLLDLGIEKHATLHLVGRLRWINKIII